MVIVGAHHPLPVIVTTNNGFRIIDVSAAFLYYRVPDAHIEFPRAHLKGAS